MLDIALGERYEILIHLDQVGGSMFYDHRKQDTTNNDLYLDGMMTMININDLDGSHLVSLKSIMASDGSSITQ
ncbi:MAG: hypothetical protein H0V70_01040 [Ktedonobacteraceae bacterium]|nr:hypothetical protein [Ktedonobacteraceae bacterium]